MSDQVRQCSDGNDLNRLRSMHQQLGGLLPAWRLLTQNELQSIQQGKRSEIHLKVYTSSQCFTHRPCRRSSRYAESLTDMYYRSAPLAVGPDDTFVEAYYTTVEQNLSDPDDIRWAYTEMGLSDGPPLCSKLLWTPNTSDVCRSHRPLRRCANLRPDFPRS